MAEEFISVTFMDCHNIQGLSNMELKWAAFFRKIHRLYTQNGKGYTGAICVL